ncbi:MULTISPECIES: hypothetical protein [Halorussus]|uniref:hypothetical protein n=1 Tax=Halorussus TaxID=1070314 RepID=UPI00209E08CB|nr:hypothetical protein [Halorussus vallis]USZ78607.1 hypothetical protein NGM07_24990 [Halorussus vallis]
MSTYTETTCSTCGEAFETRENWLFDHETCPECFAFPDVHPDDSVDDEFNVYLVSRVQAPPKCGPEANYYRVAARSEPEALWFAEAYMILEYEHRMDSQNRRKLADLEIAENGRANTNTYPELSACQSSIEWHDGYTVRDLGFRGTHGDDEDQRDLGPNTTDQFTHMSADDYRDVLVHATEEQIDHKLAENVPDDHLCYWTVNGTSRQTRHGQRIWFENDGRIVAGGIIDHVESGRIWFSPLERVDADLPKDAPSRGFTYLDTEKRPEVLRV